jgi:hypothetical protein
MSVVVEDRNLREQRPAGGIFLKGSYPGPCDLQCVARITLGFVGVAARIA